MVTKFWEKKVRRRREELFSARDMKDKFTSDCLQKRLSTENHSVLVMICDILQELPRILLKLA
jgi:hypothetical protein